MFGGMIEGPKIQSKIQIVYINGNKLGCFINENVLNPKKMVQLIAKLCPPFCFAKRGPMVSLTQGKRRCQGKIIKMHCKKIELVSIENVK